MKKKVFWIIYYAVAVLALVVALIFLRELINFSGYSAFPIVGTLLLIVQVFFYPSRWRIKLYLWDQSRKLSAWFGELLEFSEKQEEELYREELPFARMASRIALFCIPFVIAGVWFCAVPVKIVFGFLSLIPSIVFLIYEGVVVIKEAKISDKKRERELEEQKKREELGKWK